MVVARSGGQKTKLRSEPAQPRANSGVVVGMVDLQGKKPGRRHQNGLRIRQHRPALYRSRVRKNRHATGPAHQPDRLHRTKGVLVDVRPPAVADPFWGKGSGNIGYDARLDQRTRDVRPADRPTGGYLVHSFDGDGNAQRLQPYNHVVGPPGAVSPQPVAGSGKQRLVGIEEVRQQVQGDPGTIGNDHLAGDLRAPDQSQPRRQCARGLQVTGDRVVVSQRHDIEPRLPCSAYDVRWRLGPVGGGRVGVQIDTHAAKTPDGRQAVIDFDASRSSQAGPIDPSTTRVLLRRHRMDLAQLAEFARDEARGRGVDYADVRSIRSETESIDVRDGDVQGVGRTISRGVGVRVLVAGSWGFASTNSDDEGDVRKAVEHAVDIARASGTVQRERVRLEDTPPPSGTYLTSHQRDPFDVPLAEKVDHLLAAAAAGREVAGVAFVEATCDAWKTTTHFRSTEGGSFDQTVVQIGAGLRALAIKAGEVQRRSFPNSFRGQFSAGGWEDVLALDLAGNAAATAREAVALLDAPELPAGRRTIILDSSQLALQVHESVGHATELDRILGMERAYAGTSFVEVKDRGHLRYGSPLVTITADATTPGALGTFGWDDEGVAAGETTLIEDGLLVGFLTNRECAAVIGERSNGTARADSWGTIPLIRMNNVSLQPREGDLESIIADTQDGLLLQTNKSWSIDDRRVNFQFSCEAAYEVHRGERGQLYKNPSYAGRTTEFWGACDAIGGRSDWRVWGVPNCGKGQPSQTARVGHGAATGRFRDITTGVGA